MLTNFSFLANGSLGRIRAGATLKTAISSRVVQKCFQSTKIDRMMMKKETEASVLRLEGVQAAAITKPRKGEKGARVWGKKKTRQK